MINMLSMPNMLNLFKSSRFAIANKKFNRGFKTSIYNISDLHLENYTKTNDLYKNIKNLMPPAQILILAGDIGYPVGKHGEQYKELLQRFKQRYEHVVVVPGNHEYFQIENFDRNKILDKLNDICTSTSCYLLNNHSIEIEGIKIMGTTLWTKIDPRLKFLFKKNNGIFRSIDSYQNEYLNSYHWLQKQLAESSHERQIIVTHHLPSYRLQHKRYKNRPTFKNSTLNTDSLFFSEILCSLDLSKVSHWFAGHTHEYMSITHGNTSVIVNPYGNGHEERSTKISSDVHLI